jgi:hypothetical protein
MLATPTDGRWGVTPVCSAAVYHQIHAGQQPWSPDGLLTAIPRVGPSRWQALGGTDAEAEGANPHLVWSGTA